MPKFLDTSGQARIAIGICGRCSEKKPMSELMADPNFPGLLVCSDDIDQFDPYRLPARETEQLVYGDLRPDVALLPGPMNVPVDPPQATLGGGPGGTPVGSPPIALAAPANPQQQSQPWHPNAPYAVGYQITPSVAVGFGPAGTQIFVFLCLIPGKSGATAPNWPTARGVTVTDGSVLWINNGLYLP